MALRAMHRCPFEGRSTPHLLHDGVGGAGSAVCQCCHRAHPLDSQYAEAARIERDRVLAKP